MLANLPLSASEPEVQAHIDRTRDELRNLWMRAREAFGATVIQQTVLDVTDPLFGGYDRIVPAAPRRVLARLNERLAEVAASEGVLLLDIAGAAARDGLDLWHDRGRWFQGKLEISPQAAPLYGEHVVRLIAAQRGLSKKCLVLDLDNTVWGGVIGDDGIEGIVLGEGNAVGEAHLALQRYAKQLSERGIILAVCSKNDLATAEAAFKDHPDMVLKRADIAAFVANWEDKAKNLRTIAEQLNIGVDSFVFVDDNPAERARIRESLPAVAVPELPGDVTGYVRRIAEAGYFEAVDFTAEDRQRVQQYAANAERDALRGSAQSIEEFLQGLGMSLDYGPVTPVNIDRVTQLINKTNQFNTTTRRYAAEEVSARSTGTDSVALQFRLLDKFGDNGIVSAMILRPDDNEPDVLEIESWVMSCRVFGRELEHEAMNIAVEAARDRGVRALIADYIPTKKNTVIRELYPSLGFSPVDKDTPSNGPSRWILDLDTYSARKTHIARLEKAQ
jgi:FkbH-like protein